MKILAQIILRKSQREGRLVRCLRDNACLLCTSAYAHTCYNKVMFTYDFTLKFDNGKLMASHQNNLSSYCVCFISCWVEQLSSNKLLAKDRPSSFKTGITRILSEEKLS